MATASGALPSHEDDLRRSVTIWGSYAWGYADVGADIYVALGFVMGIAMGYANIAFAFAGVVYVCIGLAYTELAAAYPVAGRGQFFVNRALGAPVLGSLKRDWVKLHKRTLTSAGELEMLDEYRDAIALQQKASEPNADS